MYIDDIRLDVESCLGPVARGRKTSTVVRMDPLDVEVGRRIEGIRVRRGMKQSDLAARLKSFGLPWSQRTVSRIETGERTLRFTESFKLASALSIDPEELAPEGVTVSLAFDRARRLLREASIDSWRAEWRLAQAFQSAQAWRLIYELSLGKTGPFIVHGRVSDLGYWLDPLGKDAAVREGKLLEHAHYVTYINYPTVLRALGLSDVELAEAEDQADSAVSNWLAGHGIPHELADPFRDYYADKHPTENDADRMVDDILLSRISALFEDRFAFVEFTNAENEKQFRVDGIDFDTIQGPGITSK